MNKYNGFSLSRSAFAFACSLLFSAGTLFFVIGPAKAASQVPASHSIVMPLA